MKLKEPSRLELQVLSVLWERGRATVREVQEALPDGKTRAYTTVLTVLQVMEKKGLLTHISQGNTHVYQPTTTQRQTLELAKLKQLIADQEVKGRNGRVKGDKP